MGLSIVIFTYVLSRIEFSLALTASIISIGISYGIFILSTFFSSVLTHIIYKEARYITTVILAIIFQTLFFICLFKVKRLSNGLSFLKKRGARAIGCILSAIIMFIYLFINRGSPTESVIWLLAGVVLCIIGIIIWWRRGLTKYYRERVKERNLQELEKIISEKDIEIAKLREDNEAMASLIHRDNKLMPALSDAVVHYIKNGTVAQAESKRLLMQIQQQTKERTKVLQNRQYNKLPSINNPVLDGLIRQMVTKASGIGAQLEVKISDNFISFDESIIPELKFQTIIADLIENAIYATTHSENKRIEVTFNNSNGICELSVKDSGELFKAETLISLGIKKATTRHNEGGSGIGYMTIFEILQDSKASLIITEYEEDRLPFTKSVTVRFNGKFEFLLVTNRVEEVNNLLDKSSIADTYLSVLPVTHSSYPI